MYVERGIEEIVCLKMEMGLREEEEREFDESVLLCLRLRASPAASPIFFTIWRMNSDI